MKIKNNIAISDTGFIFNPETGESFSLNASGKEIMSLMKEGKSYKDIKKYMLDTYDTDESSFERDFDDFKILLKMHNLIEN